MAAGRQRRVGKALKSWVVTSDPREHAHIGTHASARTCRDNCGTPRLVLSVYGGAEFECSLTEVSFTHNPDQISTDLFQRLILKVMRFKGACGIGIYISLFGNHALPRGISHYLTL